MRDLKGVIFDLDGVLVDTARFHYRAWKELAEKLGIGFGPVDNERLKGVSRMDSLEIILSLAPEPLILSDQEKKEQADEKNNRYVAMTQQLSPDDALPGVRTLIEQLKSNGIAVALGSASKNARGVMDRLELTGAMDAIVDGTMTTRTKPDPQVFLIAAEKLGLEAENCVVIEDAAAGVEAARQAEMHSVGIGSVEELAMADLVVSSPKDLSVKILMDLF